MRRSCSQRPSDPTPRDALPQSAASRGRVRFRFLSWRWLAGIGVLASVLVYLADGTIAETRARRTAACSGSTSTGSSRSPSIPEAAG